MKQFIPIKVKLLILNIIPAFLKTGISKILLDFRIKNVKKTHRNRLKEVARKEKVTVIFLLINVDSWKLDSVYKSFDKHDRFEPIVIVCPFITKGDLFLIKELKKSKIFCQKKGYKFFVAYDEKSQKVIDVKKIFMPDITFFTNPNNLTFKELLIDNFLDTLTCFVPYSFRIDNLFQYEFDNNLVNLTWLNFYESEIHYGLAKKYSKRKGSNVVVTGFPFLDSLKKSKGKGTNYEIKYSNKKKIIWAPHWTIKGIQNSKLNWSCFLDYHLVILNCAKEFFSDIEVVMKPHPFLRPTLERPELWGKEKTDSYFKEWELLENCEVVYGDYTDLFLESHALIHDSGSFMTEYLSLNKPIAYTLNKENIDNRFNEFGKIVFKGHELVYTENDIRRFIKMVIEGEDSMLNTRNKIIESYSLNPENLISESILEYIINKIT